MAAPKRVLLMDDSPVALEATRQALELAGYDVVSARDLRDLDRVDTAHADLVLMDVWMPEMYGDDVATWLKTQHGLTAPIILLSSLPEVELAERARQAEVHGYLSKRAGLEAVVQRVRSVLGASARVPTSPPLKRASEPRVTVFLASARQRLRRCQELTDSSDGRHTITREMHTLEGEASLFGAPAVAEAAEALRIAALGNQVGQLRAALAELGRSLEGLRGGEATDALGPAPVAKGGRRILILDDSDFYRSTMLVLLEDAGHTVSEARSLSEARQVLHQAVFDLVLLDVNLEDGRGTDLIEEVRALLPNARLVVLSGGHEDLQVAGADAVLAKSTETGLLLGQLETLLAP